MKLAILVTGMYREFYTSIQSWGFIDSMDCDFYFLNLTFFQVILHKKFFNLNLYKANERIFLLQVRCSDYQ